MTKETPPSPFFGAYNARHINPEEIAQQFVPSGKFWELIALRHSLLIGPRGSGKTHLLKMLQPKAIAAWEGDEAAKARAKMDFWGVFTPADINWKIQVDQKAQSVEPEHQQDFSRMVFLSHFREAFIACILQLTRDRPRPDFEAPQNRIDLSKENEVAFCISLADAWKLRLRVPSLDGLKLALVEELVQLGEFSRGSALSAYMAQLLRMNLLGAAREIAEHFVSVTGLYSARWALCFDELEIAPPAIQRDLFQYLRSTDQRFIFKLAISPSNDASGLLNTEGAASAGNDYDAIPLWFVDQREREQFCLRLWEKQTLGTRAQPLTPVALLQRSRFQFANQESAFGRRRYQGSNGWKNDFERLERIDPSFSDYLRRHAINVAALETTPKAKMDSVVRKIAPLVGFRNAYLTAARKDAPGAPTRRTLKGAPPEVFSGWEAICSATEGNPRWFNGIASRLILRWSGSPSGKELTREQQTQELEIAAKKFLSWINAIPISEVGGQLSLHELLSALALHFEQSVLGKTFTADPVLAFTVDEATPDSIRKLVMAALNIGAIVIADDADVNFTALNPVNRTFRLVHLLAPHFGLPMRKGKARSLSTIIARHLGPLDRFRLPASRASKDQLGLFQ